MLCDIDSTTTIMEVKSKVNEYLFKIKKNLGKVRIVNIWGISTKQEKEILLKKK